MHAVITHDDVPKNVYGHLEGLGVPADEPLLAEDDVRYAGQPIALVAAEDEATALEAVDLIDIEYEERPAVLEAVLRADADVLLAARGAWRIRQRGAPEVVPGSGSLRRPGPTPADAGQVTAAGAAVPLSRPGSRRRSPARRRSDRRRRRSPERRPRRPPLRRGRAGGSPAG